MKVIIVVIAFASICYADKLRVDVYYESLCPDSLNFIKNQLYPSWRDVASYVDLNFVPFGKSSSNGGTNFECQHGPRECMGNRLQSCALRDIQNPTLQVEYVNCFMTTFKKSDTELAEVCVNQVGLKWEDVKQCYESEIGTQLQLMAEQETNKVSPKFVPTIIYNGTYNQHLQELSLVNFKETVCSQLNNICKSV